VGSPNEPGNGNDPRPPGPVTERGDVPPWQRGSAGRAAAPRHQEGAHAASGLEERINRFISGPTAAPQTTEAEPAPPRSESPAPARPEPSAPTRPEPPAPTRADPPARTDAIRSELPDLSGPVPRPRPKPADRRPQVGARPSGPVRASMQIRRVDPWSVLKVSLVLSVAMFFVWMIAVAFLYLVLGGMGVWSKLNSNVGDLLNNTGSTELVSSGTIFGGAALIGLVNIVLLTAMATIGAFIYNLTTDLVGGVEVTLADRD
jgi:hypothetical protein